MTKCQPQIRTYRKALLMAALAGVLASCETVPITTTQEQPTRQSVALPPSPPRTNALDGVAQREHQRIIATFGGEYRAPALQALMNSLVQRLGQATERPSERYQVTLLNSPVVNAFALPNGNVYVTRGLAVLANDTAEIASVLAHEMAHVITRHAVDRQELERTQSLINRVRSDVLQDQRALRGLAQQGRVAIASFSRQQELEADALSVRIIARAGLDPYGATRLLEGLGRTTAIRTSMLGANAAQSADITATHPTAPERVQAAVLAARQIGAPGAGEADRNRYLSVLQGMTFGDDANQGFVTGGVFRHPKLGLTFRAPDGFVLENSSDAVVGYSPEGGRALHFTRVDVPASTSLTTYVGSGLVDGAASTDVESITLNGLPAATSLSRTGDWTYRLFAVRVGSTTYRLAYAARDFSPGLDAQFRQSAESFRKLSGGEVGALRPTRVQLVTAGAGDTAESLSARMTIDEPRLERFKVLNGLGASDRVFAGQRYKIVSE